MSVDTDFGTLLATTSLLPPTVILFRGRHHRLAEQQAVVILTHPDDGTPTLNAGGVVIITDERIRVRRLRMGEQHHAPLRLQ